MNTIILGLGGNLGNVESTFIKAKKIIEQKVGKITHQSFIYQTQAWGETNQNDFLNQAIVLESELNPFQVLDSCLDIEKKLGRDRINGVKWKERVIDIDILFFNDEIIDTPYLKIPHPYLSQRNFVLIPLLDIIPNYIHPKLKKSIKNIKKECKDNMQIIKKISKN